MENHTESLEFFFKTLPKESKEDFKRLCYNLKIGYTRTEIILNWISGNTDTINKDILSFTKTKINGIGFTTIKKILNYRRSTTPLNEIVIDVNMFFKIAIEKHCLSNKPFKLKEIYKAVADVYGGSHINIFTGEPYVNKNKVPLTHEQATLRQQGAIRSFIEEHSSDSRQHWVKAGIVYNVSPFQNLFSNEILRSRNEMSNWQMQKYVDENVIENLPKLSGMWTFSPGKGKPTEDQFKEMKNKNDPIGMRRQFNKSYTRNLFTARFFINRI